MGDVMTGETERRPVCESYALLDFGGANVLAGSEL